MLTLAPRSEQKMNISVSLPKATPPHDYFLGFLVEPGHQLFVGGGCERHWWFGRADLPGPRESEADSSVCGSSWLNLSLSSSASGVVRVKSVGRSTAQFTTTLEIGGWPSPKVGYLTKPLQLLPPA